MWEPARGVALLSKFIALYGGCVLLHECWSVWHEKAPARWDGQALDRRAEALDSGLGALLGLSGWLFTLPFVRSREGDACSIHSEI